MIWQRKSLTALSHAPDEDISFGQSSMSRCKKRWNLLKKPIAALSLTILEVARETLPQMTGHPLTPIPWSLIAGLAMTWMGAMISAWYDSIRFRLTEKQLQISHAISK